MFKILSEVTWWPGGQVTWWIFDVTPAQVAALFGVLGSGLGAAGTGVGIAAVIFLFF